MFRINHWNFSVEILFRAWKIALIFLIGVLLALTLQVRWLRLSWKMKRGSEFILLFFFFSIGKELWENGRGSVFLNFIKRKWRFEMIKMLLLRRHWTVPHSGWGESPPPTVRIDLASNSTTWACWGVVEPLLEELRVAVLKSSTTF